MDNQMIILNTVSAHLSINVSDLIGNSHKWRLADARKFVIRLLTRHTSLSHSDQARLLGVTRSSVSKSWKRTNDKLKLDKDFLSQYETLKSLVTHAIKT